MKKSASMFLLACCLSAATAAAAIVPMAEVPEDGVIRLADYGYRDWGPELVRYRVDTERFVPGKLALLGPEGNAVPFQINDGVLCFVAGLQKGQSVEYRLQASDEVRSAVNSSLVHRVAGDSVEIENGYFGVRLPAPKGRIAFDAPAPAEDVPAPIRAFRQRGFDWAGGARFFTERKVKSYEIKCVAEGPVSVAYEARYTFEPAGEYFWRIRVTDGLPMAMITEEYDFGEITEGLDFLMLGLGENWQPQQIGRIENGSLRLEEPAEYFQRKANEQPKQANVSSYDPPAATAPQPGMIFLERISPSGAWGPIGAFDLRRTQNVNGREVQQIVGVCPWHLGLWRRMNVLQVWRHPQRGVVITLPISVRHAKWYLDVTDERSPFSTHQHDPALPESYGRREWALTFGVDNIVNTRIASGYIGLDRYKNWILDWPEDEEKAQYPRAFTTLELLGRIMESLDAHPEKNLLNQLYLLNADTGSAVANARRVLSQMQNPYGSPWWTFGLQGYNQPYFRLPWAVYAEDALSCSELPAELRAELRRHLALWAHLYADSDYDPRVAGTHLGNPNMPIGRTTALALFASLLPDHPMYETWMTNLRHWAEYRLAINTSPGGAWFEPPTYKMYGPTRALTIVQILLRNSGFGDLAELDYHKRALIYDANLTMPDPRYKNWRILPGMGNSGNTLEAVWGMGVGVVEQADPETAGFLRYMHRLASGNRRVSQGNAPDYSFFYLPDVPERPRPLVSTYIPGYGVIFRAHFGSPLETAMLFRAGYNKSHWDTDDLNVVLYGQGAPLSPGTGYQYYYGPATRDNAVYHNRCKPVSPNAREPFGRIETGVQDYGFGESVDYAAGRQQYPPEFFDDGKGMMDWHRHVIFLKSRNADGANYFVMRDTFLGPDGTPDTAGRAAFWHWQNLDTADRIRVDGRSFDADAVPFNEVIADDARPALRGRTLDMATAFGAGTHIWFAQPSAPEFKAVMTFDYQMAPNYHHRTFGQQLGVTSADDTETKTIIRTSAAAKDGFFYVVYPRKDGTAPPQCSMPAPGCLKITTPESTDYVFVSDSPVRFEADGVVFSGKAGAVRIFGDRAVLSLASGSGRVGYRGHMLTGHGPFERTIALNELKAGETDMGGYEKKIVSVEIADGVTVTGEAPFDAKIEGESIVIRTQGRARTFIVDIPPFITRPDLFVNGQRWMPGWNDWASSQWGKMSGTYRMAVSTLDGDNELVIRDLVFPPSPLDRIEPAIKLQR